jgi:CRP-like cAMP-binding protein
MGRIPPSATANLSDGPYAIEKLQGIPALAKISSIRPSRSALTSPQDGHGPGHEMGNQILAGIDSMECQAILSSLEFVRLRLHQFLHEAGEVIKSVYFLNDGLASVIAVQPDGKTVEVGITGKEGFVGIPVVFGFTTSATRVVTQCDGGAYRMDAAALRNLLPRCPKFALALQQYSLLLSAQSTQLAACNRLHEVEERLARWLLMSHDRIGNQTMPLTQDFLGQMLGTRRSTVSMSASILQKAGMITYTRGNVTIVDRAKLEEAACDCYAIIQQQSRAWLSETQ